MSSIPEAVAKWFLEERGIREGTLEAWGVHVRDDGAVILPYSNGEKVRKGIPDGERKMFFTTGQKPTLFKGPEESLGKVVFLVEGETDAMRLWQELRDDEQSTAVLGLPGIETWREEFASEFTGVETVLVVLDNDQDYNVVGRVDQAFRDIRATLSGPGRRVQRVRLPRDVKDICEFFQFYDLDVLRLLSQRRSITESRFKVLDLTQEPPPMKWLVEDMLCQGDLNLFIGEPNVGKSFLTMTLALAIAGGRPDWLGFQVLDTGRVLYIDEENPEDLIYDRLIRLGMTEREAANIRYLSNQGIRLDRAVDALVDEALEFEPTLIVIDSLTRMHTGDEDSAGAMSALYNDGLKPLVRETGACVVLLHHTNKSESSSSFRRSRGSGEIVAGPDAAYDVRSVGLDTMAIANFKSRRRRRREEALIVSIQDTAEGGVELVHGVAIEPPF
jgi:hypothetical protein